MDAASIHDAFAIEQFKVGSYEHSVFFHGFVTDLFAVLGLDLDAINLVFLKDLTKLLKIPINDKTVGLPHGSSQLVIDNQLKIVGNSRSPKAISISFFFITSFIKVLLLATFSLFNVNPLFFSFLRFRFLLVFKITIIISRYHHFRIIECFHIFVEWW